MKILRSLTGIFIGATADLIIFVEEKWQQWKEKKVIDLFQTTENGLKLLRYIKAQNINIECLEGEPASLEKMALWGYSNFNLFFSPTLQVNINDLKLMPRKDGMVESCVGHELGHIFLARQKTCELFADSDVCLFFQEDETAENSHCPYSEYLAWKAGWRILQEIGIKLSPDKFWRLANLAIRTYTYRCQLRNWDLCPLLKKEESLENDLS